MERIIYNRKWFLIIIGCIYIIYQLVSVRWNYFFNPLKIEVKFEKRSDEVRFRKTPMLSWDITFIRTSNYIRSYHTFSLLWFLLVGEWDFNKSEIYSWRIIKILGMKYVVLDMYFLRTIFLDFLFFVFTCIILFQTFWKLFSII